MLLRLDLTLAKRLPMSTSMFRTRQRKIAPPFGGFTSTAGRGVFPFLCLAAQFLRGGLLVNAERKMGSNLTWTSQSCSPRPLQSFRYSPGAGRGPAS